METNLIMNLKFRNKEFPHVEDKRTFQARTINLV